MPPWTMPKRIWPVPDRACFDRAAQRPVNSVASIVSSLVAGHGMQVSSTIMSIAHFMDQGKGALDVLKSIYPHPTITEGIEECLRMLLNKSVFKPYAFPDHLRIERWHPDTGRIKDNEV